MNNVLSKDRYLGTVNSVWDIIVRHLDTVNSVKLVHWVQWTAHSVLSIIRHLATVNSVLS